MANPTTTLYQPDFVTPPGDTIAELLEERGMYQSELAQRMGRPIKTINELIHGKTALTAETALQLERVLGTPASFWLNRERVYQEYLARQAANDALQAQQDWPDLFPVKDMQTKGLLPVTSNKADILLALLQFFGLATPDVWEDVWSGCLVNYRKTAAYQSNEHALSVWLRQGEREAQAVYTAPYDEAAFKQLLAHEIRALTCETPHIFQPQLVELCANVGVAAVFVPQIEGARVSGAARWLTKDKAIIQLSLRYRTNDHFWFSFFHEAGHIIKHGKRDFFIDMEEAATDTKEQEANEFAAHTLIPEDAYQRFVQRQNRFSKTAVSQFAQEVSVAPGIVVGRLQHDGHVPYQNLNGLKDKFIWAE